ncbi:hypothetical protein O3M35_001477 [Rhynocoris fuscipes]|uniref:Protein aurora borealis n=1 Tax=Rhynocoris fuscipes TaxID=488301 RepID=A0AAW1CQ64_9HEMI
MKDFNNEDVGKRRSGGPSSRWKTPPMSNHHLESPKSSLLFAAQSRAYSTKQLAQNQPSSSSSSSSSLVRTPRLSRTNPFEDVSSLEFDKCSPGLFIVHQSSAEKGEFKWSIEDLSRIMPAQIDSPASVQEECFDEETESAAQEAIERYFSMRHAVSSPSDTYQGDLQSVEMMSTPPAELLMVRAALGCCGSSSIKKINASNKGMLSAISSTPCARNAAAERRVTIRVDEGTQTRLSLPPILPAELEEALRPYMTNKDENVETDECNLSNTTLRRKLFFNKEDQLLISPSKSEKPEKNTENFHIAASPINNSTRPPRFELTPGEKNGQPELFYLSSPDISPIKFKSENDFTKDMSVEFSSSFYSNNQNDAANSNQVLSNPIRDEEGMFAENVAYHQDRGIFSSTVQSSQIDRSNKDTGYSTMEVDSTPSACLQQLINKT